MHPEATFSLPARPPADGPWVSVIIPAVNEADRIAAAVTAARAPGAEILVADGGSTDATARVAASAGARVIRCPRGRAVQQNTAAARARGRILLFCHADTRLPPGWPVAVVQTLARRNVVAGAFGFQTELDSWGMRIVKRLVRFRSEILQLPYGDQGLFLSAEAFRRVGGFPDRPIAEDLALVRRLRRFGRIETSDAAAVTSDRRWRRAGVLRTTAVNQLVLIGLYLGLSPGRLGRWYRRLTAGGAKGGSS
jgi:rSAM/selenodomain-associated transferase 2